MAFGGGSGGGGGSVASSSDVALSTLTNDQVLTYNSSTSKWANKNPTGGGGGGGAYALGRVRYSAGWPSSRPSGYAYIDWIKSSASDPDPSTGVMIAGDTISEWQ